MAAWLQSAFSDPVALIALLIKLASVTLISIALGARISDRLGAWLHAWLGVQATQTVIILIFSLGSGLTRSIAWGSLAVLLASACAYCFKSGALLRRPAWPALLVGSFVALPILLWVLRALLLADFTWDAQVYSVGRVGLWMNYRSVLIHMPTQALNLFVNEWNGELNALFYALAAGNIQGAQFGNVEVLIVAMLAVMWTARRFGANPMASALAGLLMATTPAFIGLAAVIKGDLLACVGIVMAAGLLAKRSVLTIALAGTWSALAAGSKISVLPGVVLIMFISICLLGRVLLNRRALIFASVSGIVATVFLSRFVLNQIIYGSAFMRVEGEVARPSLFGLFANLDQIGGRSIGFFPMAPDGVNMWTAALAAGLGGAGWVAIAGMVSGRLRLSRPQVELALLNLVAIGISAYLISPVPWGFRYFLPFVCVLGILGMVSFLNLLSTQRPGMRIAAAVLLIAIAYGDFFINFLPGEMNSPGGRLDMVLDQSVGRSPLQRAMISRDWMFGEADVLGLGIESDPPKKLAVLNELNTPILIFIGSKAQNRLYLADTLAGLAQAAVTHHADLVVISKADNSTYGSTELARQTLTGASMPGYRLVVDSKYFLIAQRVAREPANTNAPSSLPDGR